MCIKHLSLPLKYLAKPKGQFKVFKIPMKHPDKTVA